MPLSTLPPGEHRYEDILDGLRCGLYRFARLRAASGRLNYLIGVSPEQLAVIRREARRRGLGLALLGSRVSGPRVRQRELDPVLSRTLPLHTTRRLPSATYPGVEGVRIEKTAIKERGARDPHTSDLSVILVDLSRRPSEELDRAARELEHDLKSLRCSFPIKVFAGLEGRRFCSEAEFRSFGASYLERHLDAGHGVPRAALERAFSELYAPIGLPRPAFSWRDAANGAFNALLASVSFSLALGFHPVVPAAGFAFGFLGRHLARLKAWVAGAPADTFLSNGLALAVDAGIGACVMALAINPLAGYGIPAGRILWTSALHAFSKGSVRLAFDKHFSSQASGRQGLGVCLAASVNFLQGLATAYVYGGSRAALLLQVGMAAVGLGLVFRAPLARLLKRRGAEASGREASTLAAK